MCILWVGLPLKRRKLTLLSLCLGLRLLHSGWEGGRKVQPQAKQAPHSFLVMQ